MTSDIPDNQRRNALLAAAHRAFVAHGAEGTSLDAVIAEAGGSRRNIYNLFGGKDGLIEAVVEIIVQDVGQIADSRACSDLCPRDWLILVGEAFTRRMLDPDVIAVIRYFSAADKFSPNAAERLWQIGPAQMHKTLAAWLEMQNEKGRLQVSNIEAAAVLLPTMWRAEFQMEVLIGRRTTIADGDIRANVAHAVDLFLAATEK